MPAGSVRPLVISNVTVIDTRDGSASAGQDVVIESGAISRITPTGESAPAGAEVVDASGRYVVPGLMDMHAHPFNNEDPDDALKLLFAHGVTGFRGMAGTDELLKRRRDATLNLPAQSPALLATAGPLLTAMNAPTPDAAVAEVARQQKEGADFIKMASITPEVYEAAQAEANRIGIPLAGHLPTGIDVRDAIRAGLRSIEHLGPGVAIPAAVSDDEAAVQAAVVPQNLKMPKITFPGMDKLIARLIAKVVINPALRTKPQDLENLQRAIDAFDEQKAHELGALFAASSTWNCPTLIRVKAQELCDLPAFASDPDLRFMSQKTIKSWRKAAKDFDKFTAAQRSIFAAQYGLQLKLTKIFDEEGAPLLAGTDCVGAAWVVAGASLHREFEELASAGLTPLRILQLATLEPARFLGTDFAGHGVVAAGSPADLVIIKANPLETSSNLRLISGVVRGGRHTGAAELTVIKEDVASRGLK